MGFFKNGVYVFTVGFQQCYTIHIDRTKNVSVLIDCVKLIIGKPAERLGRKTEGLNSLKEYDSQLLGK